MKPLNANEKGCDPISSNCVIWQGPDIPCIDLCRGDTISDITHKLATELCNIMETLNINTYEEALSVFNLAIGAGAPADFEQLMQFILDRIHNLEECTGCTPDCNGDSELQLPEEVTNSCCEELVDIASCFEYEDPASGDWMTQMTLAGYVHAIGNEICDIQTILESNEFSLKNHETRIGDLENRSTAAPVVIPTINPVCLLSGISTDPFEILTELELRWCQFRAVTGDDSDLLARMGTPSSISGGSQVCDPNLPMTAIPGWFRDNNLSESLSNMWKTIEDLRCGVSNALECCPAPCEQYAVTINANYSSPLLQVWFQGFIPSGFGPCDSRGVKLKIVDGNDDKYEIWANFEAYIENPAATPFQLDISSTPLDPSTNFRISGTACITDQNGTVCERVFEYYLVNTSECPAVVISSSINTEVDWWLTSTAGTHTYLVELRDSTGSTVLQATTFTTTAINVTNGTFGGLTAGTTYRVRVHVTTGSNTITCPDQIVTTTADPCYPPTSVIATPTVP